MKKQFFLAFVFAFAVFHCGPSAETKQLMKEAGEIFGQLPDTMPGAENDTPEKVALGKKLYFETALSIDGTISCNSCHDAAKSGTDNAQTSTGVDGQKGGRNAPTVLNAGFHIAQFWDGRAADLKAQAKGPILNPIEMAMPSEAETMSKLKDMEGYADEFAAAFPGAGEPMTYDNLAEAIAAFERTLVTNDRFDDFIGGDHRALTADEQAGLRLFIDTGCATCHNGPSMGGDKYRKIGMVNAYPTEDVGRFAVTGDETDRQVFKVPSLRNVALTHPYFHDGSVETLEEAIRKMAYHQLGVDIKEDETDKIAAFLKALTGKNRQ